MARPSPRASPRFEIRLNGHLGSRWAASFDGLNLVTDDDGATLICGPVVDQSALHGLLLKLRDLGLPLVSLTELLAGAPTEPRTSPTPCPHTTLRSNVMITLSGLTKRYGARTAVDDLTFTVAPGRVTGFVGPNGAGGSTAMRMMVGSPDPMPARSATTGSATPTSGTRPGWSAPSSTPAACTPAAPPGTTCGPWPP